MDPVTLTTGAPALQEPGHQTDAPIGHPGSREDLTQPRHGQFTDRESTTARNPLNTYAPPSSTLDAPREPVDTVPQQGMRILC